MPPKSAPVACELLKMATSVHQCTCYPWKLCRHSVLRLQTSRRLLHRPLHAALQRVIRLSWTHVEAHLDVKAGKAVFSRLEGLEQLLHEGPLMPLCHDVDDEFSARGEQSLGRSVLLHCH